MAGPTSNLAVATPEHRLICRVCEKQYSKYTCPQCNLRYCSLACYKNHSLRCTESFMRNNVMEEMRDIQSTQESQQSIVEALKRLHFDEAGRSIFEDESLIDQDVEDDDLDNRHGTILSGKALKIIATGGDICLDDLTVKERKAFLRAVAAGKLSHLIPLWNPWWLNPFAGNISITTHGTSLIQSLGPLGEQRANKLRGNVSERALGELPAPPSEPLSQVRQLMQVDPSPLISVFLAELMYSYCFTLRFYNGDWQSEPLEAALILLSVSQVLDQAATPESIRVAFAEAVKTICSPTLKHAGGFEFAVALFNDCSAVLRLGRACVLCALADLHRMFESAKSELKAEVGAEKQEMIKHQLRGRPGNLDGKSNCSSTVKLEIGPRATRKPSREGVRERGSQGRTFAELPNNERNLPETRNRLSTRKGDTHTSSKLSQSSRRTGASGSPREQKKSSLELRKITAALQKIYFLMCWTNEQPSQILSSLALLVDAEKDRLMESSVTQNIELLSILQEVKAPVTKSGPIIEEARAF